MKTLNISFFLSFFFCLVNAQIVTNDYGNVAIGCNSFDYNLTVDYDMYVPEIYTDYIDASTFYTEDFEVCDIQACSINSMNYTISSFGGASLGNADYEATLILYSPQNYCSSPGYSNYALNLYGDLFVDGYIYNYSDKRLKKNIKNLNSTSVFDKFSMFDSKSYNFLERGEMIKMLDKEKIPYRKDTIDLKNKGDVKRFAKISEMKGIEGVDFIGDSLVTIARPVGVGGDRNSYGFLAQDVEKAFPDLVKKDENGLYTIDYISFIPLLFQATKELKSENDNLKAENEYLRSEIDAIKDYVGMNKVVSRSAKITNDETVQDLPQENDTEIQIDTNTYLKVNPNPIDNLAELHYNIPAVFASAMINVFDINGKQVNSYPLSDFGTHAITVTSTDYGTGLYTCALIVDGRVATTTKMIIKN